MIKLIIFLVLGLAVGIGGGTTASVMKAKKSYAAYEARVAKAVADSIAKDAEHPKADVASSEHGAAPDSAKSDSDAAPHGAADASHGAKPAAHGAEKPAHGATKPATTVAAKPATPSHDEHAPAPPKASPTSKAVETVVAAGATERPRLAALPPKPAAAAIGDSQTDKVAKIFGAMPSKDAAKVMEQLDDNEVQSIMNGLSAKQAAGIMQYLPPARAAAISKLVLRGGH